MKIKNDQTEFHTFQILLEVLISRLLQISSSIQHLSSALRCDRERDQAVQRGTVKIDQSSGTICKMKQVLFIFNYKPLLT